MNRVTLFATTLLCIGLAAHAQNAGAPARMSESQALAAVTAELEQQVAADKFAGTVLIAKNGKPIFQAAYGAANRERQLANTLDTKFRFGSMGKMFTAVGILQLVQAGKLKLDAPLATYLPDYPNEQLKQATLHQLLTHTAGAGNIFGAEFEAHRAELKTLQDYVALFGKRAPEFTPGLKHEYSNYGFVLLGRVIEVVSGQAYATYVREHIFKPAGMLATDNLPEAQAPALAIPYTSGMMGRRVLLPESDAAGPLPPRTGMVTGRADLPVATNAGELRSAVEQLPYSGTSAGGGYSTVGDLLKFANALQANQLLDAQHTQLLTAGKVATPMSGQRYAYGFEDARSADGVRQFGHGGGAPGMNGCLAVFPDSHYTVIVLANRDPPAALAIERFISARLPSR